MAVSDHVGFEGFMTGVQARNPCNPRSNNPSQKRLICSVAPV